MNNMPPNPASDDPPLAVGKHPIWVEMVMVYNRL